MVRLAQPDLCSARTVHSIDDTEVKDVSTFKIFRYHWKNHVDNLAKECSRSIGILYKVKQFLPESAL